MKFSNSYIEAQFLLSHLRSRSISSLFHFPQYRFLQDQFLQGLNDACRPYLLPSSNNSTFELGETQ